MDNKNIFILRYSDFEDLGINTINEHTKILNKNRSVLWGWFKKPYEELVYSSKIEEWTYKKYNKSFGSTKLPKDILLCNFSKKEVYKAKCNKIITSQTISAEETKLIPEYYHNMVLQYWFCLTQIEMYNYDEFYKIYNNSVNFSSDDTILTRKVTGGNDIIETQGNCILHVSDLHFGPAFNYWMDDETHRAYPKLLDKFSHIANKYQNKIGIIVASGDFSFGKDSCRNKNFSAAQKFLIELCDLFEIEHQKHLIIVPGNHDKGFIDEMSETTIVNSLEEKINNTYDSQYRSFKKAITNNEQITDLRKYLLPNDLTINFAAFDSSDLQSKKKREYGYIDLRQFDILRDFKMNSNDLNMAVLHYPFILPPTIHYIPFYKDETGKYHSSPLSILENSYDVARELKKYNFKFILHGHQHYPYFGKYIMHNKDGNADIGFLSAGSLGLNISNQHSDFPYNSFNIYEINKNKIDISVYRFLQRDMPELCDTCKFKNHQLIDK